MIAKFLRAPKCNVSVLGGKFIWMNDYTEISDDEALDPVVQEFVADGMLQIFKTKAEAEAGVENTPEPAPKAAPAPKSAPKVEAPKAPVEEKA